MGLISSHQAQAIGHWEATQARPTAPARAATRPSGIELLAYLGVLIALAGVFVLIYASGTSLASMGVLTAGLGVGALAAAYLFRRSGGRAALRAAGACAGLGAAAVGVGIGQIMVAAGILTQTVTHTQYGYSYTTTSSEGAVLVAACIAAAIAIAVGRVLPAPLPAVVVVAAAYTAAAAAIVGASLTVEHSAGAIASVVVLVSLALGGYGETVRHRPQIHGFYGLVAIVGASVPLYFLGGGAQIYLDVVGAAIAVIGLGAGLQLPRPGMAFGGVIGVFGLVFDIGGRNFSSASSLGAFLVFVGAGGIGTLVAINHLLRARRPPPDG
ncbi:MAG: hypothetical protein ACR2GX_09200 [Candidatus Dormibacteria bacterium]